MMRFCPLPFPSLPFPSLPFPSLPFPSLTPHHPLQPTNPPPTVLHTDKILSSNQPLTDQHYKYFLYQILRGLKFIHSADVIHRDLKPSNLLVNGNCDLAVCDFGLSRGVTAEEDLTLTEYVVTRWYRAPELLCDVSSYGKGVDIWSIGCIFAEMICRRPFFQGQNPHNQLAVIVEALGAPPPDEIGFVSHPAAKKAIQGAIDSGKQRDFADYFPRGTNPEALDLMKKMLVFLPEGRITVEEALEHKYLGELHRQMKEPEASSAFNFDFEVKGYENCDTIPKEDLQDFMFQEMLQLKPIGDESMESMASMNSLNLNDDGKMADEEDEAKSNRK